MVTSRVWVFYNCISRKGICKVCNLFDVYIQVRHDQHESKLAKKETSSKILYQLHSSAKTVGSGDHSDSSKVGGQSDT